MSKKRDKTDYLLLNFHLTVDSQIDNRLKSAIERIYDCSVFERSCYHPSTSRAPQVVVDSSYNSHHQIGPFSCFGNCLVEPGL